MNTLKSILFSFFTIGLIAASPVNASPVYASPLGLATTSPALSVNSAIIDYLNFDPDGDLSTFGAVIDSADGLTLQGITELSFGIAFDLADPSNGPTGGFAIDDANGLALQGSLIAIGFLENTIELQFDSLFGSLAGEFGSSVLARVSFVDSLGSNPFESFIDLEFYEASITILNVSDPVAVNAPGGFGLMLAGLLGLVWIRNRRAVKS